MDRFVVWVQTLVLFANAACSATLDATPTKTCVSLGAAPKNVADVVEAVVRVDCGDWPKGTGFIFRGLVITAEHLLDGCTLENMRLHTSVGESLTVANARFDGTLDLAVLEPSREVRSNLRLSKDELVDGELVTTWGYPAGYTGVEPILAAGYYAGVGPDSRGPDARARLFVNAAFNGGNSGGPLVRVADGAVVGVVVAKLAPIPDSIQQAIDLLRARRSGLSTMSRRLPDGRTEPVTDGQLIGEVLLYLRTQTQLVVGLAVPAADLERYLQQNVEEHRTE